MLHHLCLGNKQFKTHLGEGSVLWGSLVDGMKDSFVCSVTRALFLSCGVGVAGTRAMVPHDCFLEAQEKFPVMPVEQ